ncbi:MAG TPA: OmpA family protein [Gemmatimonadales bacterium]|nr:OmpA family protein [Gemmatimonadales bacterium]
MRRFMLSVATLAVAAMPVRAQEAGTFEIGGFARYVDWDTSYELKNYVGGGARLGVFVAKNLELEAQGSFVSPRSLLVNQEEGNKVDVWSGRGLLEYNINFKPFALILGAGVSFNSYGGAANDLLFCSSPPRAECTGTVDGETVNGFGPSYGSGTTEIGPMGLVGIRFPIGSTFQIRVDGTYEYFPSVPERMSIADWGNHLGVQGGVSLVFGKGKPKDADMDGVNDKLDQCPNTPAGTPVDANGCPTDDDRDGVINPSDLCPSTPAGERVDASGCSDSQRDDDRDGVMNSRDKCPNTPAGAKVNADGCPADGDGDGVNDGADRCPNTPKGETVDGSGCSACQRDTDNDGVADCNDRCPSTNAGNKVDANGCRMLGENNALILKGVTFATGRSTLTPNAKTVLDGVADELNTYLAEVPSLRVEVGGHTDATGSAKTNTRLSASRAAAVEKYLESKGIDPSRLVSKGYGPDKPIADNATKEGRAENRRVELTPLY